MIAPGGTPQALIEAINKDVVEAIMSKAVREKLASQYMEPVGNSPAAFRKVIESEIARWAPIVRAADVKVN
jgi:tripartite-type tricarboxylate transporter receptor subunit TctC